MPDAIWIALIGAFVAVATVVSPIIVVQQTNKSRRSDKEQEWARLDAVAEKAEVTAKKVAAKVEEAADLLRKNNKLVADSVVETQGQLKQIHTLVNSDKDALLQSNLAALIAQQVALREIITLKRSLNQESDPETAVSMQTVSIRIEEIKAIIADRAKQAELAKQQARQKPASSATTDGKTPIPVVDEHVAGILERSAAALERTADAAEEKAKP